MPLQDIIAMRQRARASAGRFTEEAFGRSWLIQMEKLIEMASQKRRS